MNDPARCGVPFPCNSVDLQQAANAFDGSFRSRPTMFDTDNENAAANRDEPLPVIAAGSDTPPSDSESKPDRLRQSLTSSKLKGRLQDAGTGFTDSGYSLQDRLLSKSVSRHHNATFEDQAHIEELAG